MDDVLLIRAAIIERCLRRIGEEYALDPSRLANLTHQDAIILNLERACQAAIDMAMHVVAQEHLRGHVTPGLDSALQQADGVNRERDGTEVFLHQAGQYIGSRAV